MRKLVMFLVAVSMALAATTYVFWRDREDERARVDALQLKVDMLESRRSATLGSQPTSPIAPLSVPSEVSQPQAAGTSSADADIDSDADDYMAMRRRMLRDPKYYETARAAKRPHFAARRAELIRVLGLSAATADAIVDYWIDRQLRSEARLLPVPTTEQETLEMQERVARERLEDEEKLRTILGEDLYPKMQEYLESRPSRNRTSQLRIRLADGSDALRDDQVEPLIGVLYTEQTRLQQDMQDFFATLDPATVASSETQRKSQQQIIDIHLASNRRIRSSAAAILSAKQLAELEAMLRADFESMQAESALRQMEASAGED